MTDVLAAVAGITLGVCWAAVAGAVITLLIII